MGWLTDGWAWLDTNSKPIGALSSIVFGLSGAAVAWVAFRLNYRNNFGWRPLVVMITYGVGASVHKSWFTAKFEVWNRQKYPVIVRQVNISFKRMQLIRTDEDEGYIEDRWYATREGELELNRPQRLDPNTHFEFKAEAPVMPASMMEEPTITVAVFDPRLGKMVRVVSWGETWRSDVKRRGFWRATKAKLRGEPRWSIGT